jgi:radical SAM superfamily enzyme YgiQ (UPF0313 family)
MPEHITQEFLNLIKLPNPNAKKLNYLFVMPRIATSDNELYMISYGLCLVSSALKASGRNVFTLNLNYKANPYELLGQTIVNNSIDVVLTGGISSQYSIIKEIIDTAKSVKPEVITCVGGGIITAEPIIAMKALETADYGVIGEGEITVNALAYALENNENVKSVEGVIQYNTIQYNTIQPQTSVPKSYEISSLDILPFPDYEGFEYDMLLRDGMLKGRGESLEKTAIIATGRSCPFNCTFCFRSSGKKYRRRSIDNIFEEIDWVLSNYNIKHIVFIDELFVIDKKFVKEVTDKIKERNITYYVSARVDMINKEILQMLKNSGCYQIFYGVESANNHILKSMRKNITVEQIEQAFDLSSEVGLPAKGLIIFGDLEETEETIRNSLSWWQKHQEYNIRLLWILTFPGSYLYKIACERGIISDSVQYLKDNNTQLNLTKMPNEQYWKMVKKVELFQMLSTNDADIDFDDMDNIITIIAENLEFLIKNHKIAIWPTTRNVITMLDYILPKFISSDNVFFINVNNNPVLLGFEDSDKKIYAPNEILNHADIVLHAFGYRDSYIYEQIKEMIGKQYQSVKRLIKISELSKNRLAISTEKLK